MPEFSTWLRFKVRTLDEAGLRAAAMQLTELATGHSPDLILGVRTGGFTVAKLVAEHMPSATLLPITCRRASTEKKNKSSLLKKLLLNLPHLITNQLRIVEHIILTQLRPPRPSNLIPDANESAAIAKVLQQSPSANILIVDDAVDSGATLYAVMNTVRQLAPNATIKTAAITVTTTSPLIQPDFYLYHYVLCRFPWSLDFKR